MTGRRPVYLPKVIKRFVLPLPDPGSVRTPVGAEIMKTLTLMLPNLQGDTDGLEPGSLNEWYMKKGILILLLIISITARAQALKDALYSGKLKTDSGTVIRKGDDLSLQIDTSRKKTVEVEKIKMNKTAVDSSMMKMPVQADFAAMAGADKPENNVAIKDNNKIWKEFMDSVISELKADVLPSKKIKKDSYFVMIDYEIGTDGQVNIKNVTSLPENSILVQEIKAMLGSGTPLLNPVLSGNGQPRKVLKRFNFTLIKE